MRGNRRWYGGPVWALVMMLALVVSSYAPVVLAEPGTEGQEQEVPEPEVQIQTGESPGEPIPPDTGTGGGEVVPANAGANEPVQEPEGPVQEISGEEGPLSDDPVINLPDEDELDPTEAPGMSLMSLGDEDEAFDPNDLAISLSGPSAIAAGQVGTYEVTVANSGPAVSELTFRVYMLDDLAAQVVSQTAGTWCDATTFVSFTCTVSGVPAGGQVTAQIAVTAQGGDPATCEVPYIVRAEIELADGNPANVVEYPSWASAALNTTLTCPDASVSDDDEDEEEGDEEVFDPNDLTISLSGPDTVRAGTLATYQMTITNSGPAVGPIEVWVFASHELADQVILETPGGTWCESTIFVYFACHVPGLPAGGQVVIQVSLTVLDRDVAACETVHPVVAEIRQVDGVFYSTSTYPSLRSGTVNTTLTCPEPPVDLVHPEDLQVSIAGPDVVKPGGAVFHTVTISNAGPTLVEDLRFNVTWPANGMGGMGIYLVSPGAATSYVTCDATPVCRAFDLAPGGELEIRFWGVTTPDASSFCGEKQFVQAAITSADGIGSSQGGSGWADSALISIDCDVVGGDPEDLSISLTSPNTVQRREVLTVQIVLQNNGTGSFGTVVFGQYLVDPHGGLWAPSVVLHDGAESLGCFAGTTGACIVGHLGSGGRVVVDVSFDTAVVPESACGQTISAAGVISAAGGVNYMMLPDPTIWYTEVQEITILCEDEPEPTSEIQISLIGPATIGLGGPTGYTFTVQNTGDVVLEDVVAVLPITWDSGAAWNPTVMTPGASVDCAFDALTTEVHCLIDEIGPGQSVQVAAGTNTAAMAESYCGSTVSQTAVLGSVGGDTNNGVGWGVSNQVDSLVDCGVDPANFSITLSGPGVVNRGEDFTFEITVTNTGDETAGSLMVSLSPLQNTGSNWEAAPDTEATCNFLLPTFACDIAGLGPGESITIAVSSATDTLDTVFCATTREIRAHINRVDAQIVAIPSNWVETTIDCGAEPEDMHIFLAGDELVYTGEPVSYTMEVVNDGDETANEVRFIIEHLPYTGSPWSWTFDDGGDGVNTQNGAESGCTYLPSMPPAVACTVFGIEPGDAAAVTVESSTELADAAICATPWTQQATVLWVDGQPIFGGTSNSVTTEFRCEPGLTIEKDGPWDLMPGDGIRYEIMVGARGGAFERVVVTDVLPDGWTVDGWYAETPDGVDCVISVGLEAECVIERIDPGTWVAFWLVTDATPAEFDPERVGCEITNVATITQANGAALDLVIVSNRVVTETCGEPEPEPLLTVVKEGPASIERGDPLWYEITVTNVSDDTVTLNLYDPALLDTTGYGWSVVSYTGSYCEIYTGSGDPLMRCLSVALAPGETKSVRIESVGTDLAAETCEITNEANAGRINDDPYATVGSNLVETVVEGCGEPSPTATSTATVPATPTQTATVPATPTATATSTVPATPTATATATMPATPTQTATSTATAPATPPQTATATSTVPATSTETATVPTTPTQTATADPSATVEPTSTVDPTATAEPTVTVTPDGTPTEDPDGGTEMPDPGDPGNGTMVAGLPGTGTTPGGTSPGEDGKPVAGLPVTGQGAMAGGISLTPFLMLAAVLLAVAGHRVRTMTAADSRLRC